MDLIDITVRVADAGELAETACLVGECATLSTEADGFHPHGRHRHGWNSFRNGDERRARRRHVERKDLYD